jgi:hypothetical protein
MLEEVAATPVLVIGPPAAGEYQAYYGKYISLVKSEDILTALDEQRRETLRVLSGRSEADGNFRYAPEKWSAKEVLGHMNDAERIFAYRALRISRGDTTPLPGFEQDDYIRNGPFAKISFAELIEDYIAVRRASITLFRHLDMSAWTRRGTASTFEVTVRALAYIIAGHELHHRAILEQKYFSR